MYFYFADKLITDGGICSFHDSNCTYLTLIGLGYIKERIGIAL